MASCWPRSPPRLGKRGQSPFAGTARRVLRTNGDCPLFRAADDRPVQPSRHLAGDHRGGVKPQVIEDYAGGDIVLPGDASRVIRVADDPGTGLAPRPDADHLRRHDAAGGRRQGGRGRHHGNGRLAGRAPRNRPRPGADLLHLRRGDRPRRRQARPGRRSARRCATRSTATAAARSTWRPFRPTRPWSPSAA